MRISLIVAAAQNGAIGLEGRMPWHLPNDLRHFKNLTWGMPIVMGRKTFDSLGKPLPGRQHIVITRQSGFNPTGVQVVAGPDQAIEMAASLDVNEVMVIGGGEIYKLFIERANRIYLTRIHASFEGDTFLPEIDFAHWKLSSQLHQPADTKNPVDHSFEQWDRF